MFIYLFAAFQGALKIFCRIKGGQVAVDEVAAVLDSMDIPVTPEDFQEVIKYASIDSKLFELIYMYISFLDINFLIHPLFLFLRFFKNLFYY